MASQAALACTGGPGKSDSGSPVPSPACGLVVGRKECAARTAFTCPASRSTSFYRRLKRRLGRSLRRGYSKRRLVRTRKSPPYKLSRAESSLSGPQEFRVSLQGPGCSNSHRQHNCGFLHQQAGRYEIRLSRLLTWCHPRGIVLRARHIPGRLNVIADKLSRHSQVIQTEWSLSLQVFNLLFSNWDLPQVDLFATRFNHKLPQFVSPVPDPAAWAVDALSIPWGNLDVYAFPPVSLLNQVASKVMDQGCIRMVLIAPGWPNMPWFWDLVNLSVQIPFQLPLRKDLVTQWPSSQEPSQLKSTCVAPKPPAFRNKGSLMKWQQELRLLKEAQPEPFISQSGPFLSNGVTHIRWTSGRPL